MAIHPPSVPGSHGGWDMERDIVDWGALKLAQRSSRGKYVLPSPRGRVLWRPQDESARGQKNWEAGRASWEAVVGVERRTAVHSHRKSSCVVRLARELGLFMRCRTGLLIAQIARTCKVKMGVSYFPNSRGFILGHPPEFKTICFSKYSGPSLLSTCLCVLCRGVYWDNVKWDCRLLDSASFTRM